MKKSSSINIHIPGVFFILFCEENLIIDFYYIDTHSVGKMLHFKYRSLVRMLELGTDIFSLLYGVDDFIFSLQGSW